MRYFFICPKCNRPHLADEYKARKFCKECGTYISVKSRTLKIDQEKRGVKGNRFIEKFAPQQLDRQKIERVKMSTPPQELTTKDVLNNFPSRTMRPYQKEIICKMVEAFQTGKKCIVIAAPTGFGKSYVNSAFSSTSKSFYTTPQLALIDQIIRDSFLQKLFVEIRGRQNYQCYHHPGRSVNMGKCMTENFACRERYERCPYWKQKRKASAALSILSSFAYLVAEGQTEGSSETYLGKRDLLILDEAHNIEEQGLNYISVRIDPFTIPYEIYKQITPQLRQIENESQLREFLKILEKRLQKILNQAERITEITGLSVEQVEDKEKIERYLANYRLYEASKSEWVWQIENDQLNLQPVFAREFMRDLIWKRADHYIISSATILNPKEFSELTGLRDQLQDDEICFLQVPSTFPVQNRPILDKVVGPLSAQEWENNKNKALLSIEEILRKEEGNIAIHCHSYRHQQWLAQNLSEDLKPRLIIHTNRNREEKLREWMRSHRKIFVSVAFNQGQDWKYELCDAQILLKVPFPYLGDKRVERRLKLGHHQWYKNYALAEVIQAYGRAIRAEDDKARFYIVDGSFTRLVKDCWNVIPDWFKEALPHSFIPNNNYYRKLNNSRNYL